MTPSWEDKRIAYLLGCLAVIALFINYAFLQLRTRHPGSTHDNHSPAGRDTVDDARRPYGKPKEDDLHGHADYLAKYVVTGTNWEPGANSVIIAVATEDRKANREVNDAIAALLKDAHNQVVLSFFTPAFLADGVYNEAFDGSGEFIEKLGLAQRIDWLLLARQKVVYVDNPSLQNVLTANMELEVLLISSRNKDDKRTWTLKANGAGFKEADARAMAEERLVKELATDPNLPFIQTIRNTESK